jgi:hypothetical protein
MSRNVGTQTANLRFLTLVYSVPLCVQNADGTTVSQTQLAFIQYTPYKLTLIWRHVSACNLSHHQAYSNKIFHF